MTVPTELSEDAAAVWVARMDAGRWSANDESELRLWLDENPARRGLLLRTHAAWLAGDRLGKDWRTSTAEDDADVAEPVDRQSRWPRRAVLAGMAATVTALVGKFSLQESTIKYATKVGEVRRVPLSDGSVMTINSATALDVRLEDTLRKVDLAQGEAWFEVAKDAKRPFVVAAGRIQVRAIGTAFSVRIRGDAVQVVVTEGVVEAGMAESGSAPARLAAGQIAFIGAKAQVREVPPEPSSVDRALAWRGGMIDLQGTTLREAAEEFNRYNERKLVLGEGPIAAEQFDGVFRINDPEGFAIAVKNSLDVPVSFADSATIRIGR